MSLNRELSALERAAWAEHYAEPLDDRQARSASAWSFVWAPNGWGCRAVAW